MFITDDIAKWAISEIRKLKKENKKLEAKIEALDTLIECQNIMLKEVLNAKK